MLTSFSSFLLIHVNGIEYQLNQCENYHVASDGHIFDVELSFLKLQTSPHFRLPSLDPIWLVDCQISLIIKMDVKQQNLTMHSTPLFILITCTLSESWHRLKSNFPSAFQHRFLQLQDQIQHLGRNNPKILRLAKLVELHSSRKLVVSQQSQPRHRK
jgi:hypothetical protein